MVGRRVVDWWLHMAWRRAVAKQLYVAGRYVMGGRLHMARRLFVTQRLYVTGWRVVAGRTWKARVSWGSSRWRDGALFPGRDRWRAGAAGCKYSAGASCPGCRTRRAGAVVRGRPTRHGQAIACGGLARCCGACGRS